MRTRPGFTEQWFSPFSCEVLARLVGDVAAIPGRIVEIGAWEGRSTIALANAADPRTIDSVDTWAGSPGEISAELASGRDVFSQWSANVAGFTNSNVVAYRMGWREYAGTDTTPIALLFIDAEHTYVEVRDTIEAFLPFMSSGGIICGDDAHHPPVREAVLERWPADEVDTWATLWIWRKP